MNTTEHTQPTGIDMLPRQRSRHLLAIDVSDFIRRAWHGHVNTKRDEPEKAAPTAIRNIARVIRGQQPTHLLCAGEGIGSLRTGIFPEYKGNRPPKPEGLAFCEARVEAALGSAGANVQKVAGLEADDVIHGAVILARGHSLPVVICARDKDLLRLVSDADRVVMWAGAENVFDAAAVVEKWGVPPSRMTELLALAGDDGDNVPHVHGWGPGVARKILEGSTKSLAELLSDGGYHWVPERFRAKFLEHRSMISMALSLVQLRGERVANKLELDDFQVDALDVAASLGRSADLFERGA